MLTFKNPNDAAEYLAQHKIEELISGSQECDKNDITYFPVVMLYTTGQIDLVISRRNGDEYNVVYIARSIPDMTALKQRIQENLDRITIKE